MFSRAGLKCAKTCVKGRRPGAGIRDVTRSQPGQGLTSINLLCYLATARLQPGQGMTLSNGMTGAGRQENPPPDPYSGKGLMLSAG